MVEEEWSLSIYKRHLISQFTKSYCKKRILLDFQRINCLVSWFESYLLTSFQVSIKNELSNVANTNGRVAQHSTEFTLLGEFSH